MSETSSSSRPATAFPPPPTTRNPFYDASDSNESAPSPLKAVHQSRPTSENRESRLDVHARGYSPQRRGQVADPNLSYGSPGRNVRARSPRLLPQPPPNPRSRTPVSRPPPGALTGIVPGDPVVTTISLPQRIPNPFYSPTEYVPPRNPYEASTERSLATQENFYPPPAHLSIPDNGFYKPGPGHPGHISRESLASKFDSDTTTLADSINVSGHEGAPLLEGGSEETVTLADRSGENANSVKKKSKGKGLAFWMCMAAVYTSAFLGGLDLSAVGTALPTITQDLNGGSDFSWVGSAMSLGSTASMPLAGALADVFGRRNIMLGALVFFAIGSALAGAAQNMNMLIAARTVQGVGGGGITVMTDIIISDLVPLTERGKYQGLLGLVIALSAGIGPPMGGLFAGSVSWRWLFYLNLPITGVAFGLVLVFLKVRTPPGSAKEKFRRVDWTGNIILMIGTTLAIVGLTGGGVQFSWGSPQVLVPLILGAVILLAAFVYEWKVPKQPTIPIDILRHRTSVSAYLATAIHGVVSISIVYYLPVFFQGSLLDSPLRSGVVALPTSLVMAPAGALPGFIIQATGKYRVMNFLAWIILAVGCFVLSLLHADDPEAKWIGFQILAAAGAGLLYSTTIFAVLAPLTVSRNAAALSFQAFVRSFAQTWGITISGLILQNQLKTNLPSDFLAMFPDASQIAFAAITQIRSLPEPVRTQVRVAFATSVSVIWKTMIALSGLGFLTVFLMREIPMTAATDEKFAFVDGDSDETHLEASKTEDYVSLERGWQTLSES